MPKMVKAAVAGANGYAGMTLVNLLARHPGVQLSQLTSRSYAGKAYSEVFPLLGLKGEFRAEPDPEGIDVMFSCLPHNVGAGKAAGWIAAGARVIDMSADFRLQDPKQYPVWYRQEHPQPDLRSLPGLPRPILWSTPSRASAGPGGHLASGSISARSTSRSAPIRSVATATFRS